MQAHADAPPLAEERAETDGGSRKPILVRILLACEATQRRKAETLIRRRRYLLPASALGASLAMTVGAMAQGQVGPFAEACALKEVTVMTLIDDHGAAEDVPADRVAEASLTMLRARGTCYEGRVSEALSLYDSILNLGPVASLRQQR